jgi:prepilin-type N-terminal cleavage/methylation domain-containing protein
MRHASPRERGFTLIEVMISAGLLAGAAASAAYLVSRAVEEGEAARLRTVAAIAAVQKMEQLRSLAWGDASDMTTDLGGAVPTAGGRGLLPSPPGTLDASVAPYVDLLDAAGSLLADGDPGIASFARRWSVRSHASDPDLLILEVVVTRAHGPATRHAGRPGRFDVALVSLRARHQP